MSQEENSLLNLNNDYKDYILAVTRGLVGAIPFAGSLIAEAITAIIPNQRADRLVQYLSILAAKLQNLDQEFLKARFTSPGFINLFEDGVLQAVRALTAERSLEYIATIVKNGLSDEQQEYDQYKYLLQLLAELNDTEVIILQSYLFNEQGGENEFHEKHRTLLMAAGAAHMGSPQEDVDRSTVHQSYRTHMVRLGLLQPRFKQAKKTSCLNLTQTLAPSKPLVINLPHLAGYSCENLILPLSDREMATHSSLPQTRMRVSNGCWMRA